MAVRLNQVMALWAGTRPRRYPVDEKTSIFAPSIPGGDGGAVAHSDPDDGDQLALGADLIWIAPADDHTAG
jgi:hypothetical protein